MWELWWSWPQILMHAVNTDCPCLHLTTHAPNLQLSCLGSFPMHMQIQIDAVVHAVNKNQTQAWLPTQKWSAHMLPPASSCPADPD